MKAQTLLRLFFVIQSPLILTVFANAQKLPNIQPSAVYAPPDVKIDGKSGEWKNSFQAYNHATEIYYTLANDTNCLYLTVQEDDKDVIQKIVIGGINLTITPKAKTNPQVQVSVIYPVTPWLFAQTKYLLKGDAALTDSAVLVANKQINDHLQEIKISGVKEIPESSVSIYNDLGIKVAQHIDNKKVYTSEIAIPLKFLSPLIDVHGTFKYRIQITGMDMKTTRVYGGTAVGDSSPADTQLPHNMAFLMSPTYFSAEYTLAVEH